MPVERNINHMKCWLFRKAQVNWHLTPRQCAALFSENGLFEYIEECYDYLHLSGYGLALNELKDYLKVKGVSVLA